MKKVIVIAAAALAVGCAQQPTVQTGPNAEVSFDGLVRIDHSRFANAWTSERLLSNCASGA